MRSYRRMVMIASVLSLLAGCQSAYYATMEQFGIEKRHLLRDHVQKAQREQQQASAEFKDVLTRIKAMYGFDGGELEKVYKKLKAQYETCESRADAVKERIANVEQIAADLFKEWEQEIDHIANADLNAKSRNALLQTKRRYARLADAMRGAEARFEPVLGQVRDYVFYLKHNLNAQAIGALDVEVNRIEIEVSSLLEEMNASIQEAETFLGSGSNPLIVMLDKKENTSHMVIRNFCIINAQPQCVMTQYIHIECPFCHGDDLVKNGHSENGTQRYRCKACRKSVQWEDLYRAWLPEVKEQIVEQTLNSSGVRDISRNLGIAKNTVIAELKKKPLLTTISLMQNT